jgi:RNA polymerase sigma factor (sigma-70 family)
MTTELRNRLVSWFRRYTNPRDAEDLAHDVIVEWHSTVSRSHVRQVDQFIFGVASHILKDYFRAKRVRSIVEYTGDEKRLDRMSISDATARMQARQDLALLIRAIHKLPRQKRRAVILRKIHGYTQREIAARMRISENTVEQHLRLSAVVFAQALQAIDPNAACACGRASRRAAPTAVVAQLRR